MGGGFRRAGGAMLTAVALVGLTLAGCGGDDEGATPTTVPTSVPTTTASTSPSASSTTVVPGPGSTAPSGPADKSQCPPIAARAALADDETIPIDFDGDGTAETLRVYRDGTEWHVRGELAGYAFHDQVVPGSGPMAPVGAARLNPSDATQEAWVRVGNGAYTGILTIFVFRDCELQRATLDGEPVALPVGASIRNAAGIGCFMFDQGIEVFTTTSEDGILYSGESELYTLDVTSQPAPTLDLVAGYPMPVPPGPSQNHLGGLSCDLGPP